MNMARRAFLAAMLTGVALLGMVRPAVADEVTVVISGMTRSGAGVTVYFYWYGSEVPVQFVEAMDMVDTMINNSYSVNPAQYYSSGSLWLSEVTSGDMVDVSVYNSGLPVGVARGYAP